MQSTRFEKIKSKMHKAALTIGFGTFLLTSSCSFRGINPLIERFGIRTEKKVTLHIGEELHVATKKGKYTLVLKDLTVPYGKIKSGAILEFRDQNKQRVSEFIQKPGTTKSYSMPCGGVIRVKVIETTPTFDLGRWAKLKVTGR